jgi:hypothetical protein
MISWTQPDCLKAERIEAGAQQELTDIEAAR